MRVQEVENTIKVLAADWNLEKGWIEDMCSQIEGFLSRAQGQCADEEGLQFTPAQI